MSNLSEKPGRKLKVGVIFGGRSGEHEVSLMSARSVMAALDRQKYEVVPIGITRQGRWLVGDPMRALAEGAGDAARPVALLPDPQAHALMNLDDPAGINTALPLEMETSLDVVIPVLHGPYGEDGTLQGLLELADVPYVGSGVLGSAVGMDKAIFKQVMAAGDIPVLPWHLVLRSAWQQRPETVMDEIEMQRTYPVFTKPANLGSSVGINKCGNRAELAAGLADAAQYDRRIVVEQGINARELEVSVLGNDAPVASVVGEIRPRREFYDYVAKYISDDSELLIPAPIDPALAEEICMMAIKAYQAIDCAGLGRVDMLLDKDTGRFYINEINTMPGFTNISMYAKLWAASGLSYPVLLDRLIELALDRFAEKTQTRTTFTLPEVSMAGQQ